MKTFIAMLALLLPAVALAQAPDRKFGGCLDDLVLCAGPAASFSVVKMGLSDDTLQAGLIPGVGYGVTYWANEWYNVGASLFLEVVAGDGPNVVAPAIVASFAEYLRIGLAFERTSGVPGQDAKTNTVLLFGLGADFGPTPGLGIATPTP